VSDEAYSAAYLPPEEHRARVEEPVPAPGAGWIIYAGTVLAIAGVVNLIYGLAAIQSSDFFAKRVEYMTGDLETWGWVMLVIGIAQLAAGFGIWRGAQWARWLGVASAALNSVAQLMWLPSQPLAALALYALDLLVIYGLVRFGSRQMVEAS
jgi:hypothetical protein